MTLLVQAGKLSQDTVVNFAREFLLSDKHVPKEMVTLLVRYVSPQDESLLLKYSRVASYLASLVRTFSFKKIISEHHFLGVD